MLRSPRTQDISWFLDLYRQGKIDLDPPYQRKSVWSARDRKFFVDTILRNYPSPPIYLCKKIDDKGNITYDVVDGKQRLETIFLFFNNKISVGKEFGDDRVNNKKWKKISEERQFRETFLNYEIIVEHVTIPENVSITINEVFDRLNRNSRKLTEQELRHAKYDGWFITFCENIADNPFWENTKISTKARTKRMRDIQFISELLMISIDQKIHGFDQGLIDRFYSDYDISAEEGEEDIVFDPYVFEERFTKTLNLLEEMERYNSCVSTYAFDQKHLYTLWASISSLDDMDVRNISDCYSEFMQQVANFTAAQSKYENDDEYLSSVDVPSHIRKYVSGSRGASTDLPQRQNRLEALNEVFNAN